MYTYAHIYTYMYTHTHLHRYVSTHTYAHIHVGASHLGHLVYPGPRAQRLSVGVSKGLVNIRILHSGPKAQDKGRILVCGPLLVWSGILGAGAEQVPILWSHISNIAVNNSCHIPELYLNVTLIIIW